MQMLSGKGEGGGSRPAQRSQQGYGQPSHYEEPAFNPDDEIPGKWKP